MHQQPTDEHNYLALASLELRCEGYRKLLEAFTLLFEQYPMLYVNGDAQRWIEEVNHLIEKAEKVLKEEGRR